VDTLHPDLIDRLEPGFDASGEGTNGFPTPNFDEDGHGTCCAGIVAATANNDEGIAGVAPQCRIVPIRVFNYIDLGVVQAWAEVEWFVDGINFAWQSGADIASNSWGIPDELLALFPGDDLLINEAIDAAVEQGREGLGMPMFFSSGNDGDTDSIPIWPGRYHNTIAVNSTSMCDERKSLSSCDGENWEGNWGNHLDISAPGVRIPATDMQGADGFTGGSYYYYFNGTSSACPNAAGVAALILSDFWWITAELLESIIKQTCAKVGGYDYAISTADGAWGPELGHGRVDALAALELAPVLSIDESVESHSEVRAYSTRNGIGLLTDFTQATTLIIEMFDLNGRRLRTSLKTVNEGKSNSEIYLPSQATALQLIRITWDNGVETIKVLR
jgi:subtilisin family serine protease